MPRTGLVLTAPLLLITGILVLQVTEVKSSATVQFNLTSYTVPPPRCCYGTACNLRCTSVVYTGCYSANPITTCIGLTTESFTTTMNWKVELNTWPGKIYITIYAYCYIANSLTDSTVLDQFLFVYTAPTLRTLSGNSGQTWSGQLAGVSRATYPFGYSVRVACDDSFFGPGCNTFCQPTNNCTGHYTCDPLSGAKICMANWNGTNCNIPMIDFCPANYTVDSTRNCRAIDLIFVIFDSNPASSYPNIFASSVQTVQAFAQSVTMGPADYNIGVVFTGKASSSPIALQSSYSSLNSLLSSVAITGTVSMSMFSGLSRANLLFTNSPRTAYRAIVVFYNGQPIPIPFADRVTALQQSGVEQFVMTTANYLSQPSAVASATALSPKQSNLIVFDPSSPSSTNANLLLPKVSSSCSSAPAKVANTPTPIAGADSCCMYVGTWNPASQKCCCTAGFGGDNCQFVVNPCSGNPCNKGTCTASGTSYNCTCPIGVSGTNCQVIVTGTVVSTTNTTNTSSSAVRSISSSTAACGINYYGSNCDIFCVTTDSCDGHYTCNTKDGSKICMAGWSGTTCTVSASPDTAKCCESGGDWLNGACCCPENNTVCLPRLANLVGSNATTANLTGTTWLWTSPTVTIGATSTPASTSAAITSGTTASQPPANVTLVQQLIAWTRTTFNIYIDDSQPDVYFAFSLCLQVNDSSAASSSGNKPQWVSAPWQGFDGWLNSAVQLEVFGCSASGNTTFNVNADYLLTDSNSGNQSRVSTAQYVQLLNVNLNTTALKPVNTSAFNESNQLAIDLFGTFLDPTQLTWIALAIQQAYSPPSASLISPFALPSSFQAVTVSRVWFARSEEGVGLQSEARTRCSFHLLDRSSRQIDPSQITRFSDSVLNTKLRTFGIRTTITTGSFFRNSDSFSLDVVGVVYKRHWSVFQSVLLTAWQSVNALSSYRNVQILVTRQDLHYREDGSQVTRLSYCAYTGNYVVLNRQQVQIAMLTSEQITPFLQSANFGGIQYTLLASGSGRLYAARHAFRLVARQRPLASTLLAIQNAMFSASREFFSFFRISIRILGYEESFSVQKRASLVNIQCFFVGQGGLLLDSRGFLGLQPSRLSLAVALPSGAPMTFISDNTLSDDFSVRTDCFQAFLQTNSPGFYLQLQADLRRSLLLKFPSLNSPNFGISVSIVGSEQYINANGVSVWAVSYNVFQTYQFFTVSIQASVSTELTLNAVDIKSSLSFVDQTVIQQQNFQRYSYTCGLNLRRKPPNYQLNAILSNVLTAVSTRLRLSASSLSVSIVSKEECRRSNGAAAWRLGYIVRTKSDNTVILPEAIQPLTSADITVQTPNGGAYEVVVDQGDLFRVADLFAYSLTIPLPTTSVGSVNDLLTGAFALNFNGFSYSRVMATLIGTSEKIAVSGTSLTQKPSFFYRIYIMVSSDIWMLSSSSFQDISSSNAASLFATVVTPNKVPCGLLVSPPTGSSFSQSSYMIFNRAVTTQDALIIEGSLSLWLFQYWQSVLSGSSPSVKLVGQYEVAYDPNPCVSGPSPGKKCLRPRRAGSKRWAWGFQVTIGGELVSPENLPFGSLSTSQLQALLPASFSATYSVVGVNINFDSFVQVDEGFTLTFPNPPMDNPPTSLVLSTILSRTKELFVARYPTGETCINIKGYYHYDRVIGFDLSRRTSLVVKVKMSNDFHIGLTSYSDAYTLNNMYEIVVGGWADTQSVIRKGLQATNLVSVRTPNIVDANNFKYFWISWSGGVINVGQGSTVGTGTFMTYTDAQPSAVNYLAFSGWDAPGIVCLNYDNTNTIYSLNWGSPYELVSVGAGKSSWALWFDFSVDGARLNGLVDSLFDITVLNNLVAVNLSTPIWSATVPTGSTFVEVDSCLKVYVTGVLSQLDWATVSNALTAAYSALAGSSNSVAVSVVQTVVLTSTTGTKYTEVRCTVTNQGSYVSPQVFPTFNVNSLSGLVLSNGNTFVDSSFIASLFAYSADVMYSFALTSPILDIDVAAVENTFTFFYQTIYPDPADSTQVKIVYQSDSYTASGNRVCNCYYVVLVDGVAVRNPLYVDSSGPNPITLFPTQAQLAVLLSRVTISDGSSVSASYGSLVTSSSQTAVSYDSLFKIVFDSAVSSSSYNALGTAISLYLASVNPALYTGCSVQVVLQEQLTNSQGAFYFSVSLLVRSADGTQISVSNLPTIDWTALGLFIANVTGPSGLPLQVIPPGLIGSSQLMRYDFGWSFVIYQALDTSGINALIGNVNLLVGSRGYQAMFGAQDKVVDKTGAIFYKITVFIMSGNTLIDARLLSVLRVSDLAYPPIPGFSAVPSPYTATDFMSLRGSQSIYVLQFISSASVQYFLSSLQTVWSARGGSIIVAPNYFIQECVGLNGQTVISFSYFISENGVSLGSSQVLPLSIAEINRVLAAIPFQTYTAYTLSSATLYNFADAFQLYFGNALDDDDVSSVLSFLSGKWIAYFRTFGYTDNNIQISVVGTKTAFGQFGMQLTQFLYKVVYMNQVISRVFYAGPVIDKAAIQSAIPSLSLYVSNSLPIGRQFIYSLSLQGMPTRAQIQTQIALAWNSLPGYGSAAVTITGCNNRLVIDATGNELSITVVFYTVTLNSKFVVVADVKPPTIFGSLVLFGGSLSSALEVKSIDLTGPLISRDSIAVLEIALNRAWWSMNYGFNGTLLVRTSRTRRQAAYMTQNQEDVTRVFYTVTYTGNSAPLTPRRSVFDKVLSTFKGFKQSRERVNRKRRFAITGTLSLASTHLSGISTTYSNLLGSYYQGVSVTCRVESIKTRGVSTSRNKRDTSSNSLAIINLVQTLPSPNNDVDLGAWPDGLCSDNPTDQDIATALTSSKIPQCIGCPFQTCPQLIASGPNSVDIPTLQTALLYALGQANLDDPIGNLVVTATTGYASFGRVCVNYCVETTSTELILPSDNLTSVALSTVGLTLVQNNVPCSGPLGDNGMLIIIIIASVGGASFLVVFAALIWCMYSRFYVTAPPPPPAPRQIALPPPMPTQRPQLTVLRPRPETMRQGSIYQPTMPSLYVSLGQNKEVTLPTTQYGGVPYGGRGRFVTKMHIPDTVW